jgi:hypothetical protein
VTGLVTATAVEPEIEAVTATETATGTGTGTTTGTKARIETNPRRGVIGIPARPPGRRLSIRKASRPPRTPRMQQAPPWHQPQPVLSRLQLLPWLYPLPCHHKVRAIQHTLPGTEPVLSLSVWLCGLLYGGTFRKERAGKGAGRSVWVCVWLFVTEAAAPLGSATLVIGQHHGAPSGMPGPPPQLMQVSCEANHGHTSQILVQSSSDHVFDGRDPANRRGPHIVLLPVPTV